MEKYHQPIEYIFLYIYTIHTKGNKYYLSSIFLTIEKK